LPNFGYYKKNSITNRRYNNENFQPVPTPNSCIGLKNVIFFRERKSGQFVIAPHVALEKGMRF
jgi:hypothetical protein